MLSHSIIRNPSMDLEESIACPNEKLGCVYYVATNERFSSVAHANSVAGNKTTKVNSTAHTALRCQMQYQEISMLSITKKW